MLDGYTKEELEGLVQWQHDQMAETEVVLGHLRDVLDCAMAEYNRVDALYDELFPEQEEVLTLEYRLRKRAEIRRQITTRKSVQEGAPDRISDLLEEAADFIKRVREEI